ncbi:MAG: hypothetical protein KJO07_16195 [Deltaproteobacteria bacterium]|jgi:hypothetical protein|nr:hypothetical protein [Deltaproteobacteria bacterium]
MLGLRVFVALLLVVFAGCSDVTPDPTDPDDMVDPTDPPPPPPTPVGTTVFVHTATELYKMNDLDFDLQRLGEFGAEENITDLAITPDGRIFGISGESLYEVNPNNALATFVAEVPGELNVGLTFLPNGQLLATDKLGGVREIAPDTGVITEIGEFGKGWGTAGDLVAVADGTMYAIGEDQDAGPTDSNLLLTVNTSTGEAELVGELGYGETYGTAYANGKVYAFTSVGDVIEVDPNTGAGTLVRSHPDVSFWGAAVSPLVSVE